MTVNTLNITSGPYAGNDVADTFSYTFRVTDKTQLSVYETDDLGVETLLTVDTDYTVTGIGVDAGGTVVRVAGALPTGYEWYIRSNYDETQLTSFASQGGFFPDVHESAMDKLTFLIQQMLDKQSRALRISDSDSDTSADLEVPTVSERANKFLAFDAIGNVFMTLLGALTDAPVFDSKAAAVAYITANGIVDGQLFFVTSDDGGPFVGKTGAAVGVYADDGGSYCGTQFIPTGGDGSSALVRYQLEYNARYWKLVRDGAIVSPSTYSAYAVSGTDNSASLSMAIAAAIEDGTGNLTLPHGKSYIANDITIGGALAATTEARMFALKGQGKGSSWPFALASAELTGTALLFAPDTSLIFAANAVGYMLEDLTVSGSVNNGALVKGLGPFTANHGGLRNVLILNEHTSTPTGDAVALETVSAYVSECGAIDLEGRQATRTAYLDTAVAAVDLYFGTGWRLTRAGQGSGGGWQRSNIRGFDLGIECGLTAAAWAADPDKDDVSRLEFGQDCQVHYCKKGFFFGAGLHRAEWHIPHFETILDHYGKVSGGFGSLLINGGSSSGASRTGPSGTEFLKDGAFVIGDATDSECVWDQAIFREHNFGFVAQAGLIIYGGTNSGEVILDNCHGNYNGGALVAVDVTNGYPDILIRDWNGPDRSTLNDFINSRFVTTFTRNADYAVHSFADARWLARMENCGDLGTNALCPDLDLTTRKYPPTTVYFNTIAADNTITLGNVSVIQMEMEFEKRFLNNNIVISIPAGITLVDGSGTSFAGATTRSISAIGFYSLKRIADSTWRTDATTAP